MAGLRCGPTYDMVNGWDLSDPQVPKRVEEDVKIHKPKLLVLYPPCGMWSVMQNMNPQRGSNRWMRERVKAKVMLRLAMRLAKLPLGEGRLFMFEHPLGAESWKDRSVLQIAKHVCVKVVRLDQCMVGLRDVQSKKLHMKPTYIMTNSEHVAQQLELRCDKTHEHEPIFGSVRTSQGSKARSECSQQIPKTCADVWCMLCSWRRESVRSCDGRCERQSG